MIVPGEVSLSQLEGPRFGFLAVVGKEVDVSYEPRYGCRLKYEAQE